MNYFTVMSESYDDTDWIDKAWVSAPVFSETIAKSIADDVVISGEANFACVVRNANGEIVYDTLSGDETF